MKGQFSIVEIWLNYWLMFLCCFTEACLACVLSWCCRWWGQWLRQWQRLHRSLPHRRGRRCHRSPGGEGRPERARGWLGPASRTLCSPANHAGLVSPGTPPTMEIMLEERAKHEQQGLFSFLFPFFFAFFFCIQADWSYGQADSIQAASLEARGVCSENQSSHASWFPSFPKIMQCHFLGLDFMASLHHLTPMLPRNSTNSAERLKKKKKKVFLAHMAGI